MQEKPQTKKPRCQINWKKFVIQTGKTIGVPMLNGAAFALGGILIGKLANQSASFGEDVTSDSNVLPMKKTV